MYRVIEFHNGLERVRYIRSGAELLEETRKLDEAGTDYRVSEVPTNETFCDWLEGRLNE